MHHHIEVIFSTQQHVHDLQCLGMASASSVTFHAWAWPRRPFWPRKALRTAFSAWQAAAARIQAMEQRRNQNAAGATGAQELYSVSRETKW